MTHGLAKLVHPKELCSNSSNNSNNSNSNNNGNNSSTSRNSNNRRVGWGAVGRVCPATFTRVAP